MKRKFVQKLELSSSLNPQNEVVVLFIRNSKPAKINIFGEEIGIRKLNEIPFSVASWLLDHGKILPESPNFIHRNKADFKTVSTAVKPLQNGWYIKVAGDKEKLLDKTRKLLKMAGFSGDVKVREETDWQRLYL